MFTRYGGGQYSDVNSGALRLARKGTRLLVTYIRGCRDGVAGNPRVGVISETYVTGVTPDIDLVRSREGFVAQKVALLMFPPIVEA
jgi:hypothetical protein